jgi:hypothetical protein
MNAKLDPGTATDSEIRQALREVGRSIDLPDDDSTPALVATLTDFPGVYYDPDSRMVADCDSGEVLAVNIAGDQLLADRGFTYSRDTRWGQLWLNVRQQVAS